MVRTHQEESTTNHPLPGAEQSKHYITKMLCPCHGRQPICLTSLYFMRHDKSYTHAINISLPIEYIASMCNRNLNSVPLCTLPRFTQYWSLQLYRVQYARIYRFIVSPMLASYLDSTQFSCRGNLHSAVIQFREPQQHRDQHSCVQSLCTKVRIVMAARFKKIFLVSRVDAA